MHRIIEGCVFVIVLEVDRGAGGNEKLHCVQLPQPFFIVIGLSLLAVTGINVARALVVNGGDPWTGM